ncbi:hypothetical protein D3C80_1288450 [compost metagenome]
MRPTHDSTGIHIHNDGQIQPPLLGGDVGDIASPDSVWRLRIELTVQDVGSGQRLRPKAVVLVPLVLSRPDTGPAHQRPGAVATNLQTAIGQFPGHPA